MCSGPLPTACQLPTIPISPPCLSPFQGRGGSRPTDLSLPSTRPHTGRLPGKPAGLLHWALLLLTLAMGSAGLSGHLSPTRLLSPTMILTPIPPRPLMCPVTHQQNLDIFNLQTPPAFQFQPQPGTALKGLFHLRPISHTHPSPWSREVLLAPKSHFRSDHCPSISPKTLQLCSSWQTIPPTSPTCFTY